MLARHQDNRARSQSRQSLEAVAALLNGQCHTDDELLTIATIRRESQIDLSNVEIKDLICEAIEEEWGPVDVLGRLVALDDGSDGIRQNGCPPR